MQFNEKDIIEAVVMIKNKRGKWININELMDRYTKKLK